MAAQRAAALLVIRARGGDREALRRGLEYFERLDTAGAMPEETWAPYGLALGMSGEYARGADFLRRAGGSAGDPAIEEARARFEAMAERVAKLREEEAAQRQNPETARFALVTAAQRAMLEGRAVHALYLLEKFLDSVPEDSPGEAGEKRRMALELVHRLHQASEAAAPPK